MSPKAGATNGGVEISITGVGFGKNTVITLTKVSSRERRDVNNTTTTAVQAKLQSWDQGQIKVIMPAVESGTYTVTVSIKVNSSFLICVVE